MSRAEGVWGEAQIANYLRRRRYELLAHSYHCRFGEIDLIARKGGVLCFVEVKTRSPDYLVRPAEAVGPAKRRKLIETALYYTMEHPEYSGYQPRFDVMEIVAQPADGSWSILEQAYWKGAFDVNGSL